MADSKPDLPNSLRLMFICPHCDNEIVEFETRCTVSVNKKKVVATPEKLNQNRKVSIPPKKVIPAKAAKVPAKGPVKITKGPISGLYKKDTSAKVAGVTTLSAVRMGEEIPGTSTNGPARAISPPYKSKYNMNKTKMRVPSTKDDLVAGSPAKSTSNMNVQIADASNKDPPIQAAGMVTKTYAMATTSDIIDPLKYSIDLYETNMKIQQGPPPTPAACLIQAPEIPTEGAVGFAPMKRLGSGTTENAAQSTSGGFHINIIPQPPSNSGPTGYGNVGAGDDLEFKYGRAFDFACRSQPSSMSPPARTFQDDYIPDLKITEGDLVLLKYFKLLGIKHRRPEKALPSYPAARTTEKKLIKATARRLLGMANSDADSDSDSD